MKAGSDLEEGCGISVSAGSSGAPAGSGAEETAGHGDAAAAGTPAGSAAAVSAHYWEEDVFRGEEPGKAVRAELSFAGLPMGGGGHEQQPLLLAGVRGMDIKGQPFHWVARRQRKCVSHYHECTTPPPPIDWLGSLDGRRHWRKPGWLVAVLFTVGSTLFVISGVAALVTAVGNPTNPIPGAASAPAGLIGWPNAIAANFFFFPAGLIQLVEAVNMDLPKRRRAWDAGGRRGRRPGLRLLPTAHDLRTISFWVVAVQLAGMLGFNMATVADLVSYITPMKESASKWLINFGFTFGGAGFTVSSLLGCWEATGSWWRGLAPTRCSDLRSISWHVAFWNLQGSIGFLISGAATYAYGFSWTQQQWISGYGDLGGAVWFLLGALAAVLEQGNPNHP
ncbi:integral membrane [Chlorella sorokiniana]|uniref:Integral membrane n=1 Tax=Chlorella sorokiniana TaxID=3076 RepID=A0A2P6U1Z5_CHLSO|nr:integral membrane [Chlorella sorokiniana]|eukprot:PRW60337.1 integral membrane [Chlorella sorokiniana]